MKNLNKRNFFNINGYILLKNAIEKKKILNIFKSLDSIILNSKYKKKYNNIKSKKLFFKLSLFFNKYKNNDPIFFSNLYESFKNSYSLKHLFSNKSMEKILNITNTKLHQLNDQQQVIRIDVVKENTNLIGHHQDIMPDVKIKKNNKSFIGFTLWCPLFKSNNYYGGIAVIPKSHKQGWVTLRKASKKIGVSASYNVNKKFIEKNKQNYKTINSMCGDLLIMNTFLVHKSLSNNSNICRFTAQYRVAIDKNLKFLK